MASAQGPSASGPSKDQRKPSLKTWWHALTQHRRDSKDHGSSGPNTPLHQTPYQPRHAGRDALLAVPLAERKRSNGVRVAAVKRHSASSELLSVHPNRDLSSEMVNSFGSLGRPGVGFSMRRSASWSPWSSLSRSGMASIREDQVEGSDEGSAPPSDGDAFASSSEGSGPLMMASRARAGKRVAFAGAEAPANIDANTQANEGSGSGSQSSSTSSHEALRLQIQQRQRQHSANVLLAKQLQARVSPSSTSIAGIRRPAPVTYHSSPLAGGGVGLGQRRGYFGHGVGGRPDMRAPTPTSRAGDAGGGHEAAGESVELAELNGGTVKAKGKGRAADQGWTPPAKSRTHQHRTSLPPAGDANADAITIFTDARSEATLPSFTTVKPVAEAEIQSSTVPASHERKQSVETLLSPTGTAFTSDAERNASDASVASAATATTVDEEDGEDGVKGEEVEAGKNDDEDDWLRRVLEAAEAL